MKLCRFDGTRLGLVEGNEVRDVTTALDAVPALSWPLPPGDPVVANLEAVLERVRAAAPNARQVPLSSVTLNAPVANPSKIIGAPVNYQKHLDESRADPNIHFGKDVQSIEHYGLFLKANSSLVGPGEGVALRFTDRRNDHEAELAVIIGRTAASVSREDAFEHIAGYAMSLDMTVRGPEDRSLRKSIDSYSVLGPWLVTKDEIADPDSLDFELRVNGEVRQKSNTRFLIYGVARLIEYATSFYTLYPGDVIMTGTPEGVGPVRPGDTITMTMDGLGEMTVEVRGA